MSRLVIPANPAVGRVAGLDISKLPGDDYKDRLVKYIPAESVALYTFTDRLVSAYYGINADGVSTKAPADGLLTVLPWLLFALGLIGTPVYLYRQRLANQPWHTHAVISTLAFAGWAYTLGGSLFILNHSYSILAAGLVAPIFTFVAGMLEPRPA